MNSGSIRPSCLKSSFVSLPGRNHPRAKALASYAKQANDETLHRYADRIKARAIRRCGQLVKQIEPKHTGRPKNGRGAPPNSRAATAKAAGLSRDQAKQAVRVANVPEESFERQVESDRRLPLRS